MRIVETEVNDIQKVNFNKAKENLADSIISYVHPLFSNEYKEKVKEIKELKKIYITKKEEIKLEKNELSTLLSQFTKKNKEQELLIKMGKLLQTGLVQETMKKDMIDLLNTFDSTSEDKITEYLNETIKLISQKFARS